MKYLIALIAFGVGTLTLSLTAHADASSSADGPGIAVKYSSRDLSSERGVALLYEKIEAAAGGLCENYRFGHSPAQLSAYHRCVASIVGRAIATVDRAELNAYAAARGVFVGALSATQTHN